MKVLIPNLIIALTYAVNAISAVHFKVICAPYDYGGTGVNVNIDGQSYQMQSANNDILYELEYDGTPTNYYYEIAGVPDQSESILFGSPRTWDPKSTTTLYEVFGRQVTLGDNMIETLPRIAEPLDGYKKFSQLFQEGELSVINIHMLDANYNELISMTSNKDIEYTIEFDLYTPYEKYHFTNATISLSGQGTKNKDKKPYKIDLSPNENDKANSEIFKRKEFKLRSLFFDRTYIRNKLVSDMAESMGLPITQSSFCRLYLNNKSYGFYELTDMYKKKFVKRFFNPPENAEKKPIYGTLYKAVSGLDTCGNNFPAFFYPESDQYIRDLYECIIEPSAGYDTHQDVNTFIKWLEALPANASLQQIQEKLDVDMLIKDAILEYMICHWDGFLGNGNNFFLYSEPNNGKYHVFSYDFDLTLGKFCDAPQLGDFDTYVTSLVKDNPYNCQASRTSVLYNKVLKNPEVKKLLDENIRNALAGLMNPAALEKRVNYLYNFYKVDMQWDVFCRNGIIKTQYFGNTKKAPTIEEIENEYNGNGDRTMFKNFITEWIGGIAKVYGVSTPQSPVTEGKFGTVGNKIVSLDDDGDDGDNNGKKNNQNSSDATLSSNYYMPLLITFVCILLVWMAN